MNLFCMNSVKGFLSTVVFYLMISIGYAQEFNISALNQKRIETTRNGMWVLTGWGIANTGIGLIGTISTNNHEVKAFHTMNMLWGAVNTGIGVLAIMRANKEMSQNSSDADKYRAFRNVKKLYLINGGLDLLYIGTGLFVKSKSNKLKIPAKGIGYGNALILQGAGLLVFDLTIFLSHNKQTKNWRRAVPQLTTTDNGLALVYCF